MADEVRHQGIVLVVILSQSTPAFFNQFSITSADQPISRSGGRAHGRSFSTRRCNTEEREAVSGSENLGTSSRPEQLECFQNKVHINLQHENLARQVVESREGYPEGGDVVVGLDERYRRYVAEWVSGAGDGGGEDGFQVAFTGNFWGKASEVQALEGEVKDAAEVWFGI
ncbi:hypothetical protein B0H16DRAFT_1457405 [Mycena metata]|uniref:Uncharacterized protein n=1 Tax=Mycena metata TaxID=1033252 RepID=A0AAD7J8C5_9AGAR|nr:hypothetical protein B0H16DRAFT_1457405 [Mycena metata]